MTSATKYLQSLDSVRQKTSLLLLHPEHLKHFDVDAAKLTDVADTVVSLVKRDYKSTADIPPHSRKRHFEASKQPGHTVDRVGSLVSIWNGEHVNHLEQVRRMLDLFVVGVLLDAGAGNKWSYRPNSEPGIVYNRSEGLAIAAFDWFCTGAFSSTRLLQADSFGLQNVTPESLERAFQVDEQNPLVGVQGRACLLKNLGQVVVDCPQFFASEDGSSHRPGNLVDFLLRDPSTTHADGKHVVQIETLWRLVMEGFSGVWPPSRTKLDNVFLGDVWQCEALNSMNKAGLIPASISLSESAATLLPFHKLSQWLTYSLMEPLALAGITFNGLDKMTGLAEYRNGGLFVDMHVLKFKSPSKDPVPKYPVDADLIIEWRGLTIALLDKLAPIVRQKLNMTAEQLPLANILEAGTWKAGREIAAKLRPDTCGPPIEVISDGTVF